MNIIGQSDIGKVRKENQDSFWVQELSSDSCIAIVCDGMGGANGGKQASSIAVDVAREELKKGITPKVPDTIQNIINESNRLVFNKALSDPALLGMGTTLVLAFVEGDRAWLANVGDSRAYHITNGSIAQITKDHSAVQELVDSGHLTERQAKIHPNKNVITRAIGIEKNIEYDLFEVQVATGDIILLCSDGMSNNVDESEIQFEASGENFEDLAARLIDLANSRGGSDNITIAAIQI